VSKLLWLTAISVLVLVLAAVLAIGLSSNKGEVSVVNQAAEPIRAGTIEICNQRLTLGETKPNESKRIHYKVKSDSHCNITIEFASGKKLTRHLGYVTSGMDFHDTLIVKDGDIAFENRSPR